MKHIKEVDAKEYTVAMMQVENEMGVLDNPGRTPGIFVTLRALFLKNGYHKIDISFFQRGGGSGLNLMIKAPDKEKEEIKDEMFFHLEK